MSPLTIIFRWCCILCSFILATCACGLAEILHETKAFLFPIPPVPLLLLQPVSLPAGTSPHAPTSVHVVVAMTSANVSWEPGYDGGYEQTFSVWYGPL